MIKIDKNLPIPPKLVGKTAKWSEVASAMNPKDSVEVKTNNERCALLNQIRRRGWFGLSRKTKTGSFRVWRVE